MRDAILSTNKNENVAATLYADLSYRAVQNCGFEDISQDSHKYARKSMEESNCIDSKTDRP